MPEAYVAMRNKFIKRGMSTKAAKTKAARIYNSKHGDDPVGSNYDKKVARKKRPVRYPKPK